MIYALQTPLILVGMLAGFVLAGAVRAVVAAQLTRRGPGISLAAARRWQTWLDPYGALGALISGVGWVGVGDRYKPGRWLAVDVVIHSLLGIAGFAGLVAVVGNRQVLSVIDLTSVLHGGAAGSASAKLLAGFGAINLACAILALVPIPPLAMGTLLWSKLPKSPQSRRVAYHLLEEHWGVAIVLVLLILPLAGGTSLLLSLIDTIGNDLLRLVG